MAKRDHKEKVRLTQADADAILQRGLTILDTLSDFEIRHRIGYFSHILRYGKHFLQMPNYILEYRESSGLSAPLFDDASNIPKDHYFLGRWPKSKGMESNPQNSILVPMLAKPSTETHDGNDDLYSSDVFYIQQIWADGTICDLNEKPRTTTIKYYCGSHTAIELLTEVQTCEYTAIVSVEALCDEPYFHLPDIKPVNEVNCRLIVPDEEKEQEAYTEYVKKLQKDMLNAHEHVDEQYYQYPPEKDNFDVLDDAALNFELDKDPALTPEVPAKEETIDDKDLDQILFELFVKATVNPDMRDSRVDEEEGDVSRDTEVNDQALHDLYDL
ncbi:hypothetical protein Malapachy_3064 [Malassezia pachydermatis]|uniref:Protein OS-9 homolog n=1 Tax=Malassezia pachydermatis TaxID=77020 RepID=A0A0N0RSL2_9BASI|nr:hypothetical protein Malapachy_3064 [Malassezia pachydermatis]KOS15879.1 hypothetical protein Malapachy_3064 [Malassezia pachydermatis]